VPFEHRRQTVPLLVGEEVTHGWWDDVPNEHQIH